MEKNCQGFSTSGRFENENELSGSIEQLCEICFMKKDEKVPISSGTYGRIFEITQNFVAKVCNSSNCMSLIPEIAILSCFSHNCVLKAKYIFKDNDEVMFILPRYDCSLDEFSTTSEDLKIQITKQLSSALQYIHSRNFLHLDLSTKNILIKIKTNSIKACICDFSLSRMTLTGKIYSKTPKVTIDCKPYENLLGSNEFSTKTDCWSLGICLFKLYEGYNLISFVYLPKKRRQSSVYETSALFEIQKLECEQNWPPTENQMIRQLLHLNIEQRLDSHELSKLLNCKIYEKLQNCEKRKLVERIYRRYSKVSNDTRILKNCGAIVKALSQDFVGVDDFYLENTFEIICKNRGLITF